jgi:hypothetical protein
VQHYQGDYEKVAEFYRQTRIARFIMEGDYLMTGLQRDGDATTSLVDSSKHRCEHVVTPSKRGVLPKHSNTAFPLKFGNLEGQCDHADWIFRYNKYGKKTSTVTVAEGN